MKKLIFSVLILFSTLPIVKAQSDTVSADDNSQKASVHKNMVEINLFALPLKNFSLNYQRQITRKTTVGLTARLMPDGLLPFEKSFRSSIKDSTAKAQIDNFKVGNYAVMPEIRFYFSRKGAFHGFYVSLFASFAHYSASLPYNYTDSNVNKTIQLNGSVNSITGGFMLGAQWNIGKSVYLDLHIIGPNYGSSSGSISGHTTLSASEQSALKSSLDGLNIPIVKTSSTVDANGAKLSFSGPWAGIRSGLCIGFRF